MALLATTWTLKKMRSDMEKYLVEQSYRTLTTKFTTDQDRIVAVCTFRVLDNDYFEIILLTTQPKVLKKDVDETSSTASKTSP